MTKVKKDITEIINRLIHSPTLTGNGEDKGYTESQEVVLKTAEIERMTAASEVDITAVQKLIFECAEEKYRENETARQLDANYKQRGKEWERDCHIELNEISAEGNVTNALSQDCGIRIQGGWSRADYQKSFRLYARNDYGKSSFDTVFWDSFTDVNGEAITSCKTFVLRNGGNDANYSKFKDMMIQNMVSGRGVETQQGTACVVFIDGEYWGLYTLQSDYSDRYFADRYNVAKSNVVMYKNDELSEGEAEDEKLFNDMYKFITENDMSIEENYRKACAMIDMDSLVEYAATEMYIFNDDWPQNNYACWRTRTIEQGNSYADGRWRFVLFDTESSCSHYNEKDLETNMFSYLRSQSYTKFGGILCSLIDNEEFDLKLTSAMCQLGSVNFTAERFGENIIRISITASLIIISTVFQHGQTLRKLQTL